MGFATFSVKRSKNGSDLGDMTILVPKMSEQYVVEPGYNGTKFSVSDLLALGDFPVEANLFCGSDNDEAYLKSIGFPNAMNIGPYAGEIWTLNNGNYFRINDDGDRYSILEVFSNGDGAYLTQNTERADDGSDMAVSYVMGLYGDNSECGISFFRVFTRGLNRGKVSFSQSPVPDRVRELSFYKDAKPIYTTNDPYGDGGMSGTGGGTGSFDETGDDISIPGLPTLSAVDAGFITLFNPTLAQLKNLASYMWSDLFDVNTWKKIFADPMGAVLGLSIVPVSVPNGAVQDVKVGNMSTGVAMTTAASQYVEIDCGTLRVNEYWGAYLDYDPYTKAEIYLPYIGTHPLSTDEIMNKDIHVVYHVDILSGACCAYVKCGGTVLYSFIGQCASSIPITGDNWTNVINGAISIAGSIGSMVATGGATAPMAIGQIASTSVNTMKPNVEKSGAMGGTGGMLGVQTPYLILTRPRQALPKDQNTFMGYPAFITEKLQDLTGYTEIDSIHLENVPATESELSEIEDLLKGGVIF